MMVMLCVMNVKKHPGVTPAVLMGTRIMHYCRSAAAVGSVLP